MSRSWTEVQALATRAAAGAGVPSAQSLAFGAMLARHLADGGAEAPLQSALDAPERIVALAQRVEEVIEAASVSPRPIKTVEPDAAQRALLVSWLVGLPCRTAVDVSGETVLAALDLSAPSTRARTERLLVSADLDADLGALAARTYVADSEASRTMGAGANLMDTD
ncbi:hypothetical protein [uncultured Tateyamaria sp.]|uniref:hypothetical protein n=1 Tax=Tateyamaria sp. 1078 TaxID=3417464 RepID=UPI00261F3298|nr:hypothetical protein [uncultured Tateyamaria sp.]